MRKGGSGNCFARRLVIEVDGSQHMDSPSDRQRDHWLAGQGFRVLRFWDNVVLHELESVEEAILAALAGEDAPSPYPSPAPARLVPG